MLTFRSVVITLGLMAIGFIAFRIAMQVVGPDLPGVDPHSNVAR